MFLKGKEDPYYSKVFLPSEQDGFPEGRLFWGTVAWFPPKEVGPDDTLKGFRVVNVAPAACMWMTSEETLSGMPWASCDLDTIVSNYKFT